MEVKSQLPLLPVGGIGLRPHMDEPRLRSWASAYMEGNITLSVGDLAFASYHADAIHLWLHVLNATLSRGENPLTVSAARLIEVALSAKFKSITGNDITRKSTRPKRLPSNSVRLNIESFELITVNLVVPR